MISLDEYAARRGWVTTKRELTLLELKDRKFYQSPDKKSFARDYDRQFPRHLRDHVRKYVHMVNKRKPAAIVWQPYNDSGKGIAKFDEPGLVMIDARDVESNHNPVCRTLIIVAGETTTAWTRHGAAVKGIGQFDEPRYPTLTAEHREAFEFLTRAMRRDRYENEKR